ncbi:hypothetical protein Cni_G25474 [Canna indica]|uniref:FLZ-type domain-containing protein n=1 Tax=Canna indica TaxID=4628 RepID=A0AAQ3QL32_9LILI|nr:hypothetical protein Cni_G25474 [Canna indica]
MHHQLMDSTSSSSSDIEAAGCHPPTGNAHNRRRRHNLRPQTIMTSTTTRTRFFCDSLDGDEPRHFLHSCFLCQKPLASNCDIFMYRGNLPFCSKECREEQIEMDEGKETGRKLSLKASSRKLDANTGDSGAVAPPRGPPESHEKVRVRTSAAVVAAG